MNSAQNEPFLTGPTAAEPSGPAASTPTSAAAQRRMPNDFSIAVRPGGGADVPDFRPSEPKHSMRGFEDGYTDIVDWIVRITHRIWEDQDVGYIYDTYSPGCRLYTDHGRALGVEQLVSGTIERIHAFPDTRHYADEVIWAGDDEQGFVTSHRAINVGHHTGPWRWGPPTGHRIQTWVIANCVVQHNEIFEEWVQYNTAARLAQVGIDVAEAARTFGNEDGVAPLSERQLTEVERLIGGRKPQPYRQPDPGTELDVEHFVRALFHDIYNRRNLAATDRFYATNVRWYGPSNRSGYGRAEVRAMARGLLATFPDLGLQVDEVYWMGNEQDGFRVSTRWTAVGTHRGHALYGRPTGRRVHLWGLSQLYLVGGRIVEDWTLYNEFDVLAQLLRDDPPPALS